MSSALQYVPHYTASDYQQWEGDWELFQGVAVAMTPSPFGEHQSLMASLIRVFGNEIERQSCSCQVLPELDWVVDDHTVVRPDIMIVCDGLPERHLESPPALIVEILSSATAQKDRVYKLDLYRQQGVHYYLLADPKAKQLDVLHLADGQYVRLPDSSIFDFQLHPHCQIRLDCKTIFRALP